MDNFAPSSLHGLLIAEWNNAFRSKILSTEDVTLIGKVLIGCTKVAVEVSKRAQGRTKRITGKLILSSVVSHNLSTEERKFRPSKVRSLLPEDFLKIDYSEISDVLKDYTKQGIIEKTVAPESRRGRPPSGVRTAGAKSFYTETEYFLTIKKLVAKPQVRRILFLSLLESRVIQMYFTSVNLYHFATLKQRSITDNMKLNDLIAKQLGKTIDKDTEKGYADYREVVLTLTSDDLKKLAGLLANHWITTTDWQNDVLLEDFYIMGGMTFTA